MRETNKEIFEKNYKTIEKIVNYVSYLFFIDGMDINDIRQELFVSILTYIHNYDKNKSAFTFYIRMCCWNKCISLLSKSKNKSNILGKSISLDMELSENDEGNTLHDITPYKEKEESKTLEDFLDDPSLILSKKEMEVIEAMRYGSYRHNADEFDNSRQRIIIKLKDFLTLNKKEQNKIIQRNKILWYGTDEEKEMYRKAKIKLHYQELKDEGYFKEYYHKNKNRMNENRKKYYQKNKKKVKEYHIKNKEKIKKQRKEYHIKNKEKIKKQRKEYRLKKKLKNLKN